MKIYADLHTHTNASQHALNTMFEMCDAAKEKGFEALGITNHGPKIWDGVTEWYFFVLAHDVPRKVRGITLIKGAEANILDPSGDIDLGNEVIKELDIIVASLHTPTCHEHDYDALTDMLMRTIQNPNVNILGHMGDPQNVLDYEKIISHCNEFDKVIEINSNSPVARKGSKSNCLEIARLCKKYNVPVVVNSDAHSTYKLGDFDNALEIIESAGISEDMILNADKERLRQYILKTKGRDIFEE